MLEIELNDPGLSTGPPDSPREVNSRIEGIFCTREGIH